MVQNSTATQSNISQMSNWSYYLALNSDAQMLDSCLFSAEFIEGNKIKLCGIVKLKENVEIGILLPKLF